MRRNRVAWLVSLPLSAGGMVLAHELAWQSAGHGAEAEAGHGYLRYLGVFAALGAAALIVAATTQLVRAVGGGDMARAPAAWVFAVVPVVGFVLQEHVEHLVAHRELEVSHFLSTPFVLGLALQVPFALVALLAARIILGFVQGLARTICTALTLSRPELVRIIVPLSTDLPLRPALALRHAGRAPPGRP